MLPPGNAVGLACGRQPPWVIILWVDIPTGLAEPDRRIVPSLPRVVVLGSSPESVGASLSAPGGMVALDDPAALPGAVQSPEVVGVWWSAAVAREFLAAKARDENILNTIDQGVAILDPDCLVLWCNPALARLALPRECLPGTPLLEVLGSTSLVAEQPEPLAQPRRGRSVSVRVFRPQAITGMYLDVSLQPVPANGSVCSQIIALVRNVTPEVEQQRKLDALHQAGRELADLDPSQLAEMNIPTRVELLKQNLRRYIHDLLHYNIIEVRLLDRRTGELKPLLEDGMTPEAAQRVLFARDSGNGVTGYVAASGQSYLCMDTQSDPLYIEGASGARSSMTVPLKYHDEVVGTLNVESPFAGHFGPDDLQFTELFSKEIANALHTLDLLSAQQSFTAVHSLDLINREIAIPMDDVLAGTATLLARFQETDPGTAEQLRRILDAAQLVKQSIRKVGQDLQVADPELLLQRTIPLKGKRVLVLETEERFRKASHLMLGQLGAEVETVGTAQEAISLARAIPFDAVLMDVKPPDLGGYQTFKQLRETNPTMQISMMTGFGYDASHAIVKARAEGMQHVLFKPFRQDQILKAILNPGPGSGEAVAIVPPVPPVPPHPPV